MKPNQAFIFPDSSRYPKASIATVPIIRRQNIPVLTHVQVVHSSDQCDQSTDME